MKTTWRLLHFVDRVKGLVALSIGLGWATAVSWIALVSTSAWLISYAALQPSIADLQVAIVGVRFFGISRGVFRYLERLVSHTVTFRLLARLRVWLYEKIEPQAPAGLADESSGDLLTTLVDDIETLREFYIRVAAPPLVALFSSVLILAFIGQWSIWFTLTLLFFQLMAGIVLPLTARQLGKSAGREVVRTKSGFSRLAVDVSQGNADIVLNGLKQDYLKRVDGFLGKEVRAEESQNLILGIQAGLTALLINGSVIFLLILAIPMVSGGYLDGRLLAVIVLGALASFETILPLGEAFQRLEESLVTGKRIFRLADQETPPAEIDFVHPADDGVRFVKVDFAYSPESEPILRDFSLQLEPGKKVAVVGPSGAGKSTIVNLLLNFWSPSLGELLIKGKEIHCVDPESVRSLFAYLPQNPFLFNTSIIENIRIGSPSASVEEVSIAAQKAGLTDFILDLPDQYETMVGEHGMLLSGGQRQRLALARAFIRKAPFMILDEPTANLDRLTGRAILKSVLADLDGQGLLLISHDLWGLAEMDEILVLDNGRVLERGTHTELLELGGWFSRLHTDQRDILFE